MSRAINPHLKAWRGRRMPSRCAGTQGGWRRQRNAPPKGKWRLPSSRTFSTDLVPRPSKSIASGHVRMTNLSLPCSAERLVSGRDESWVKVRLDAEVLVCAVRPIRASLRHAGRGRGDPAARASERPPRPLIARLPHRSPLAPVLVADNGCAARRMALHARRPRRTDRKASLSIHASIPPSSGNTREMPRFFAPGNTRTRGLVRTGAVENDVAVARESPDAEPRGPPDPCEAHRAASDRWLRRRCGSQVHDTHCLA